MPASIIDGNAAAAELRGELRRRLDRLHQRGIVPGLAAVLVGDDPGSAAYVRGKMRALADLGMVSETLRPPASTSQEALVGLIGDLNADPRFHGILVQLPLPDGLDERAVTGAVAPHKDVDGLHPLNLGLLLRGDGYLFPCTPAAVQHLLVWSGNDPTGKHVVICGRSLLVGRPLAAMLLRKAAGANATVTVCHTSTPGLPGLTRTADILVVATGRPGTITGEMVKPGAVVIDVGTNRIPDSGRKSGMRLVGDVDFDSVVEVAGAITPVPGGVGPMTVSMLLANTVLAAETGCNGSACYTR